MRSAKKYMNPRTIKSLLAIPLAALLLLATPAAVQAQYAYSTNADGSVYTYSTNADGSVTIDAYSGPPWAVTLPTDINGLPVTCIGSNAFEYASSLTIVTIPSSVTNIESYAFADCTNLTGVVFNGNAPAVGTSIFAFDTASVYYLPGTTGWSSSFANLPAEPEYTITENAGVITITGYSGSPASGRVCSRCPPT
jgi:hypothetical protein